jgi:hypothetical protein
LRMRTGKRSSKRRGISMRTLTIRKTWSLRSSIRMCCSS